MSQILLLLDNKENRRLLAESLGSHYKIILPDSDDALEDGFDLCILDGTALDRLWKRIQARKTAVMAQFLPCLLVTSRKDVGMATRFLWKVVDELIISPIEKIELRARVESLLIARRLSLEFSHSIVQNAPLGILALDREGKVQLWNPACERIFGWSEGEVMGLPFPAVPPGQESEFYRSLEKVFRGETILNIETRRLKKDGSLIDIGFSAAPLRDADGVITQAMSMSADITSRKRAEMQAARQTEHLLALRTIDAAITSSLDLRLTLGIVLEQAIRELKADAADILLFNPQTVLLEYAAGRGFHSEALKYTRLRAGEGYAGRSILERRRVHIPNLAEVESDLTRALSLAQEAFVTYFGVPLIAKGEIKGVLEIFHRAPLNPDEEWLSFLDSLAGQAAIAIDNFELFDNLQRTHSELILAYDATIEGWSYALDLRDKETQGHTQRVVELALRLARAAGMTDEELVYVRRGALLHDIGKMGVPDHILLKPDKLTDEEWAAMRKHPQFAHDMLSRIAYLQPALDIPYCHHEMWDGTGYPRGLKGEQIPLAARLFAIVDVWDALRSDRPYRKAWAEDKALEYIRSQAGKHFDPKAVELFLHEMRKETEEHNK